MLRNQAELIAQLQEHIASIGSIHRSPEVVSTGWRALDRLLPRGGIARGSIVEWLSEQNGSGVESLALRLTCQIHHTHGDVVVLDRDRQFYPPALVPWGISFDRVIVVHPLNEADELWAAHQALRCPAVSAVWLRRDRLQSHDFRRLSLAAEKGGTIGILFRPTQVRGQPTWAEVQLCVQLCPSLHGRKLRIEVTRCRGHLRNSIMEVAWNDIAGLMREAPHHETFRLPASAALANSTADRRSAQMAWTADPRPPA